MTVGASPVCGRIVAPASLSASSRSPASRASGVSAPTGITVAAGHPGNVHRTTSSPSPLRVEVGK